MPTTAKVILNLFRATLSESSFRLPVVKYTDWTSASAAASEYPDYVYVRRAQHDGTVAVILLAGPAAPEGLPLKDFTVANNWSLGTRLIELSLENYFSLRGLTIHRTKFGTSALRASPEFSYELFDIFSGLSFRASRPFALQTETFFLSAQWKVSAAFRASLAEPRLAAIGEGNPVLFVPAVDSVIPPQLLEYRGHYVGKVIQVGEDVTTVLCRDEVQRKIPSGELFLEATPSVIHRYERACSLSPQQSLFNRLQMISFVLTQEGRRNVTVLKDRFRAIRSFWAVASDQLILPIPSFSPGLVHLDLTPTEVQVESV